MTTQTISQKYPHNKGYFSDNEQEWGDKYLGKTVQFSLNNHKMIGKVVSTERYFLANGIHDILEIELENDKKQVKIQIHRQAVKLLS